MLKRISIIAFLTGAGQIFIIFTLKFVSEKYTAAEIEAIARIDSLLLFMINILALGLQPAAMREIALNDNWKPAFSKAQSARFTLALMISVLALLALIDPYYLVFLLAPLFALSGDYALYGTGYPVKGALIAFARIIITFSPLLAATIFRVENIGQIYVSGAAMAWIITSMAIAFILQTKLVPAVSLRNLRLYIKTLYLGMVSLGLYFIGIGVILIIPYFYDSPVVATAFIGLKFYVIFKGVLRIIQQAFLKEMIRDDVCLKVDQLSTMLGLSFSGFIIFFPESFIRFFFGESYLPDKNYFILLSMAALVYSLFSSFTTRAMLDRKDKGYAMITLSSAFLTCMASILFSFFYQSSMAIGISLLMGELIFAAGMLMMLKKRNLLQERILFLLGKLWFLLIPAVALLAGGDRQIILFSAIAAFALLVFIFYKKQFTLPED